LHILRIQQDTRGRDWALIKRPSEAQALGWIFRDFLSCTQTAQGPSPPASPSAPSAPPPRIETARLKDARIFLDDAKKFIGQQKSVPSISEIAEQAANLQTALNQFDERGAIESKQKLDSLLKPIPSFTEFVQQQQAERNRQEARLLTEGRIQAKQNEHFVDTFLQRHLGDSATQPLLSLRGQIEIALKSNTIEELRKANDAVASYVKNNGLAEAYAKIVEDFGHEPTPPRTPGTLRDSLTEKSKFLLDGPADEIILLYNASPSAPKVWKNVRGDVVFQDEAASICFAQPGVELGIARYVDRYLANHRAKKIASVTPPCDLARAGKAIDIIAFRREELLTSREDYILVLAKMVEGDVFRPYETIKDYDSEKQKGQARSLQIEADLDNNSLNGFGVISVTDMTVACVVPPKQPDRGDGLKELLKRNADLIAPTLTAEWRYIDTGTNDLAFLGLQRHQCGFVLGDDKDLRTIMLALRREKMKYSFAPLWWDEKEVDQATFDTRDAVQREIMKQKDIDRKRTDEAALQAQRDRDKQNQKTEIERKLRDANGTKARGLMNYAHDLVSRMAEERPVENADFFPGYSNWLNQRFSDKWETFNVGSDVADFGSVRREQRELDAVVVKTVVQQKKRILGKYEDRCYLFGFVSDNEFSILRDPFAIDCDDTGALNKWKAGERFQSRWNAD
jgi:hypothetical protein